MKANNEYLISLSRAVMLRNEDPQNYFVDYYVVGLSDVADKDVEICSPIIEPLETWEIGQLFGGN